MEDVELMPDNEFILNFSPYDGSKKTVFLIHGFTDSFQAQWVLKATSALLAEVRLEKVISVLVRGH